MMLPPYVYPRDSDIGGLRYSLGYGHPLTVWGGVVKCGPWSRPALTVNYPYTWSGDGRASTRNGRTA